MLVLVSMFIGPLGMTLSLGVHMEALHRHGWRERWRHRHDGGGRLDFKPKAGENLGFHQKTQMLKTQNFVFPKKTDPTLSKKKGGSKPRSSRATSPAWRPKPPQQKRPPRRTAGGCYLFLGGRKVAESP